MIVICLMTGMATKFSVFVDEDKSKISTFNWLLKLHKIPQKSRFIANLVHVLLLSYSYV